MRKTLGIALGAGGSRGVAHVGFLRALEEAGIQADFVAGCSMGSIVGALYCAGISMEEVRERVLKLRLSQIASLNINAMRQNGVFNMNKARKLLAEYIGAETRFQDLKTPFRCVATDLNGKGTVVLSEGNVLDSIVASSSVPGVFTPVTMGDMMLLDGGVLERVPAKVVKRMGADVVVAVDVLGDLVGSRPAPKNLIETFLRYIDTIDTQTTRSKRRSRMGHIDLWLEPDLGTMDQYQVKNLATAYEKGYETGKENVEKIRALLESDAAVEE